MRRIHRALVVVSSLTGIGAVAAVVTTACSSSQATSGFDAGEDSGNDETDAGGAGSDGADDAALRGDTIGAPCDPLKQDCADPKLRCTLIYNGSDYVAGCEPPWDPATNKDGEVCSRKFAGYDDCVKGYACLAHGNSITATACHKICASDSDCGQGAKCAGVTTIAPYYGVCWKTCTPFIAECGDAGNTCSYDHYDNDGVHDFISCREIGTSSVGATCTTAYQCGADMICTGQNGAFACRPMCDDAHVCDGGAPCSVENGLPNNGGFCP